jgi:hypothetical protein
MVSRLYTAKMGKKVNQLLADKGVERYCPLNKVRRKWSDRVKVVEEPVQILCFCESE